MWMACLLGVQLLAVFGRSDAFLLLEHATEMLGIFKAESVGYLRYGFARCQSVLGQPDDESTDVIACRIASGFLDDVAEIIG